MDGVTLVPTSMREAIAGLGVGESYAKCKRVVLGESRTRADINTMTDALRNTLNPAMRRAMEETGHTYTLETGGFLTKTAFMLVAAVTRME